ncbi:DUF5711 family protein [Pseudobutyrivibrio sp. MD2005]|uniref:DUF5711 family protein n=1 Tax=Pseudobutyrivibrio sp. MD2005 TaxID=1410616 RepID=UPI000480150E|nr:DUF5711 family protein [Pseudobutyrivibrio sp. MD2005]
MEEFKIITLPNKKDNEDEKEEKVKVKEERVKMDDDYNPPKKRYFFIFLLLLIIVVSILTIRIVTTYDDYEVEKTWERQDSAESHYLSYNNNLIKYSADGIFYTNFDGSLIWNYTYDMVDPSIDICDDYIVVYDKKGSEVDIFSTKGFVRSISTTTPVIEAKIASQGTVAMLLQEGTTSYIQMYDRDGTLLVSGEIHPENRGFPISMALSSDATRLLLSIVNIDDGEVSSELVFYDFTSAGKKEQDNIVATYQYIGALIPKVDFVKNNKAIAFSDSRVIIFNNNTKATVAKDISVGIEMKSIFYNDTHFGFVCEKALDNGEVVNELNVYNLYGFKCVSKEIANSYQDVTILDNNEVFINNGNEVALYNLQGFERFSYTFDESVYSIIPATTSRRYYVIQENKTEEIYLK